MNKLLVVTPLIGLLMVSSNQTASETLQPKEPPEFRTLSHIESRPGPTKDTRDEDNLLVLLNQWEARLKGMNPLPGLEERIRKLKGFMKIEQDELLNLQIDLLIIETEVFLLDLDPP
ncbi:hypothetical protein K8Q93_03495 [Candidatus Parcubacteria bacterium]|nr:hypothetical protein [Candidatus Parcubacteria bacterium]